MKRLCTILAVIICTFSVFAQNNVFVLVDVSKSVSQTDLNNAKQALIEVLTGSSLSTGFVPPGMGSQQDLINFRLSQGDKLAIAKFGSSQTTSAINPIPITIQNINTDVNQVINSISWTPTDLQTYITLAKAKIAEYAKNHSISRYKLYIISDNRPDEDDFGNTGNPNYPNSYIRNLAEGYNTSTNPVSESGYTKVKFNVNLPLTLSFCPEVDVSGYNLPQGTPPTVINSNSGNAEITITTPPAAKKGNEYEIKTETINVNWTCNNCPPGIKYTVTISEQDGGKFKDTKKDLVANTATFKLPEGKFKITVSSSNFPVKTDSTYIKVPTGNIELIIFLIILLIAAAVGYYFWNKKRLEKLNVFESKIEDDIFSKNSGGTSTGNSTNTDYF